MDIDSIESYYELEGDTDGFLLKKIPEEVITDVKTAVETVQSDFSKGVPYNHNLEGQIDKEYWVKLTDRATSYIRYAVEEYDRFNPRYFHSLAKSKKLTLEYDGGCWINFQKKYEYNPIHQHNGILSFVIWYQIPFYKEDEMKYGAGKNRGDKEGHNGEFEFVYSDGKKVFSQSLGIDKTMEGYMAIFPSELSHIVYPFYTSDDYRITLSGNILTGD